VILSQENLPSKSSDWGLPPRWKNDILALGIFPTHRSVFSLTLAKKVFDEWHTCLSASHRLYHIPF